MFEELEQALLLRSDAGFVIGGFAHLPLFVGLEADGGGGVFDRRRPIGVFAAEDFVRFEDGEEPADRIATVFEAAVDAGREGNQIPGVQVKMAFGCFGIFGIAPMKAPGAAEDEERFDVIVGMPGRAVAGRRPAHADLVAVRFGDLALAGEIGVLARGIADDGVVHALMAGQGAIDEHEGDALRFQAVETHDPAGHAFLGVWRLIHVGRLSVIPACGVGSIAEGTAGA